MTAVHQLTGQLATMRAYHLPPKLTGTMPPRSVHTVRQGPAVLEVPDEEPAYYRALVGHLRASHTLNAPQMTDHRVIELLVHAARLWREPSHPFRLLALSVLPALTGYAPAMIEEGLDHRLAQLTPERLGRLVDDAADRLAAQGGRLEGPSVVLLVVAGHIPGLVIDDLAALLLVKSACVIRPSARDPVVPLLFVRTLAELDPRVGELLAVVWWPRGADAISTALGGAVDSVVASGDDTTIATLSRQTSRIIGYGHRRSVALIGAEALTDAGGLAAHTAERLARDVCWYEQLGCLAPQLVYVEEGGQITARQFAEQMAAALGHEAEHWPPSAVPIDAASSILQLRADVEFRETAGAALFMPSDSPDRLAGGTVLFDPDPVPRPSPGYRTLWVKPAPRLESALESLSLWQGRIESIGMSLSDERLADLYPLIDRLAPSRLTPIGTMQEPPLRWRLLEQGLLLKLSQ